MGNPAYRNANSSVDSMVPRVTIEYSLNHVSIAHWPWGARQKHDSGPERAQRPHACGPGMRSRSFGVVNDLFRIRLSEIQIRFT